MGVFFSFSSLFSSEFGTVFDFTGNYVPILFRRSFNINLFLLPNIVRNCIWTNIGNDGPNSPMRYLSKSYQCTKSSIVVRRSAVVQWIGSVTRITVTWPLACGSVSSE